MKRPVIWLPLFVFFLFPDTGECGETVWLTNYDRARETARASGKPIFAVFRCEH
jgi:hypothetical protein